MRTKRSREWFIDPNSIPPAPITPVTPPAATVTGGWRDYAFLNRRDVRAERERLVRQASKPVAKELKRIARGIAHEAPMSRDEAFVWASQQQTRETGQAMVRTMLDRVGAQWTPELDRLFMLELTAILAFQAENEGAILALLMEL